jgi:hypothetical protein
MKFEKVECDLYPERKRFFSGVFQGTNPIKSINRLYMGCTAKVHYEKGSGFGGIESKFRRGEEILEQEPCSVLCVSN